jgi:aspartate racemase
MTKIGIVGGVGWRSTVEYYSEVCRRAEEWHRTKKLSGTPSMPEMVIESLNLARTCSLVGNDADEASWCHFDEYHRRAFQRLESVGAEVAVMASNSPHHRFDAIVRGVGIPVISILDAAAKECVRIGARRVLLLGTALTMRSPKFPEAFAKHGIELAAPHDEDSRAKTMTLIAELQRGRVKGAAVRLARIIKASWRWHDVPVVCLACTELPLAFPGHSMHPSFKYGGVTYVNTSAAHIEAILEWVGIQ